MNAIKVNQVSKSYQTNQGYRSLKSLFINLCRRQPSAYQCVLDQLSFSIRKGEFFGIVGRNGSGKSTLLKLLAGIYQPSSGQIELTGRLVPFIELGVGFHPELSGRDNVYLGGALMGFTAAEIDQIYDEIVSFAELEGYMDKKLKNYSSGMQVRLAFALASQVDGDIWLFDEVLAVGDEAFQAKCLAYFAQLKRRKKTVVLVSHDMDTIVRHCDRAILLENQGIISRGNPSKVAQRYHRLFN